MVVIRHQIEGYENFYELIEHLQAKINNVYVMFSGSKEPSGHSWCPDCVNAEPVVEEVLKRCSNVLYIYVGVGVQNDWKNPENKFRKDDKLRLNCIPTLMKWSTGNRLNEQECQDKSLVELLFEEHYATSPQKETYEFGDV